MVRSVSRRTRTEKPLGDESDQQAFTEPYVNGFESVGNEAVFKDIHRVKSNDSPRLKNYSNLVKPNEIWDKRDLTSQSLRGTKFREVLKENWNLN